MTPNFELIAHILGDYYDLQADGIVEAANRFPLAAVEEQIQLLSQHEPAGNTVLANRIAELERDVSMHRNAEITWEKTMMQAVGEDGPKSVVEAIDAIKAERDSLTAQLLAVTSQRDGLIDELDKTQDEALDARTQRDALAAQVEVVRHAWESVKATDYDRILDEALELTPDACLAQVRAEAIESAANELGSLITAPAGMYSGAVVKLNRIAERILKGGAK